MDKPTDKDTLRTYLESIKDEQMKTGCLRIYDSFKKYIDFLPAGKFHHHAYKGGYGDHVAQVINIGLGLADMMAEKVQLNFTKDDVIVCCFLHDFDKLWTYLPEEDVTKISKGHFWTYQEQRYHYTGPAKIIAEAAKCGLHLTDNQIEAVCHAHGGWSDDLASVYRYGHKTLSNLAVIVHCADLSSGFIWGRDINGVGIKAPLEDPTRFDTYPLTMEN